MHRKLSMCLGLFVALLLAASAGAAETKAERDARMDWWRNAKFGMFIHWGVYAVPAGTYHGEQIGGIGEWIMLRAKIPVAEYRGYAKQFNPVKYDPQAWAELAKQAGMRYVVITSKHHDGFALYDSDVTEWDIADATPYGRGLLEPLAKAVRDEGLKFGLYYSQAQDWTHPGGAKAGLDEGQGWDEAHQGDFDNYLESIAMPQTKEILARFQPDVLWWDTPTWMTAERAEPLHQLLKPYPHIITNNRLGGGFAGDTETPEQHIPATGFKDRDWETCMTMNDTWGFKSYDHNWKSTEVLLHNLVDIVSKGGNYLLNVGPTAAGEIPQESIDRLREIGAWMQVNGDAIYGTTASPCRTPAWGRITSKPDRLYLHVFDWPTTGELMVPIAVGAKECHALADAERNFQVEQTDEGLVVKLTGEAIDPICSVIELAIDRVPTEIVPRVEADTDGRLVLASTNAVLEGSAKLEQIGGQQNIGYWTDAKDSVTWHVVVGKPGKYQVVAEVAAPQQSRLTIGTDGQRVQATVRPTGDFQQFKSQPLGVLDVPTAGNTTIQLQPQGDQWRPINLRTVILSPVE